jgi:hypothetical protein
MDVLSPLSPVFFCLNTKESFDKLTFLFGVARLFGGGVL